MGLDKAGIKRRTFLKQSVLAGLSVFTGAALPGLGWSASKERLMILSSIGLDTLHPYAHSSGPQYGIWQHMIEPLVEINYARKDYYGVLAESCSGEHVGVSPEKRDSFPRWLAVYRAGRGPFGQPHKK